MAIDIKTTTPSIQYPNTNITQQNQSNQLLDPTGGKNYGDRYNLNLAPVQTGSIPSNLTNVPATPTYQAQEVAKPTSVVGPGPATNQVDQIKTAVNNQVNTNTAASQTPSPYNDVKDPLTGLLMNPPGALYDRNTGKLLNPPTDNKAAPTAEDKIANAPESGYQEAYNLKTGQREDQPIGTLQSGYSIQNPNNRNDVSDVATDNNGVQYKQFSDGTYGRFDGSGNYSQATASSFQAAKNIQTISDKINSIINGTFQLPPQQQAQLDGLSNKYASIIQQTETNYANAKGGTISRSFLGGTAGSSIADSAVTTVVNAGIEKVRQLQIELASGLATMQDAFYKDDYSMLKDSYNSYQTNQTNLQQEIDKQTAYLQGQQDKQDAFIQTKNMNYALQQSSKYGDAGILPTDTPEQVDQKKQTNSAVYKYETSTKSGVVDQNALDGMLTAYKKTGEKPTFGLGNTGNPMRLAFYAALDGITGVVDEATLNKAALKASSKALDTQQNQYSATQTSVDTMKKGMSIVENVQNDLFKTGSPLLNQPLQFVQNQLAGNSAYAGLNTALTTVATEYAKIMSGAAASIAGVSVTTAEDIKKQLSVAMSKGQIESALNVMKQDANARITSQKDTIDNIKNDISELGSTNTSSTLSTGYKNGGAF